MINSKKYESVIKQAGNMAAIFLDGLSKATASMSCHERNLLTLCLLIQLISCNVPVIAEMEKTTVDNLLSDLTLSSKETIEWMREEKQKRLEKGMQ